MSAAWRRVARASLLLALLAAPATAHGQPADGSPPVARQAPPQDSTDVGPDKEAPDEKRGSLAPTPDIAEIDYEDVVIDGTFLRASMVTMKAGEYTLTGRWMEGDYERELTFSGEPTLTFREQTLTGDAIRFRPKSKTYTVDNPHAVLSPDFLGGRLTSPLFASGQEITGRRSESMVGTDLAATACDRPTPHYLLDARVIEVEPGKQIVLRRAKLILWGKTLLTLPTVVVPLSGPPKRRGYMPEFGRSQDEGWFVKAAFDYTRARNAPGVYRVDLMERKGVGLGVEQAWRNPRSSGGASLYYIPTGPSGKNLSGRLNVQQRLGAGQTLTLSNDFQRNSYLALTDTTSISSRVAYQVAAGSYTSGLSLARQATDSSGYTTTSTTAALNQSVRIGQRGSVSFGGDYSKYSSASAGGFSQQTERLVTRLQASERASNYALELSANRTFNMASTSSSFFGGVERLPEIALTNYRFTQGLLSRIPASFAVSAGRYEEGSVVSGSSTSATNDRVMAGFDVSGLRYALTGSTELDVTTGFQQFFYGDGSAQYVVRNNSTLTQRWNKTSGLRINYSYQRGEGGTPFRFDAIGQYHTVNADAGWLDDRHVQFTARVGYDLAQQSFGGVSQPWQTVSANLMLSPVAWARLRNLFSFDPNTGRFVGVTSDMRLRGRRDFSLDLVTRYDPKRRAVGQVNGYLSVPIGSDWRINALMQYNGYLSRFESKNLQIIKDLHCLEASLTYSENPFGYRADRQIYFQLRIKAFPLFQKFGVGPFGQALDTSVGEQF